jgi:hypothetical protein
MLNPEREGLGAETFQNAPSTSHLRCWTQDAIAKQVGVDRSVVADEIAENAESTQMSDSHIFRDFEQARCWVILDQANPRL